MRNVVKSIKNNIAQFPVFNSSTDEQKELQYGYGTYPFIAVHCYYDSTPRLLNALLN